MKEIMVSLSSIILSAAALIILKLTGVLAWKWIWALSPLLVSFTVTALVMIIIATIEWKKLE
jgi:hypothetical protein